MHFLDSIRPRPKVRYKVIPREDIEVVEPLWHKLNDHHMARSTHFAPFYDMFTFNQRMEKFRDRTIRVRIDVALIDNEVEKPSKAPKGYKPKLDGKMIGYSLSSVNKRAEGELDSLFVDREFRRMGIGTNLAKRSFAWMDKEGALTKSLSVIYGNEEVLPFYRKFKFYPSRLELNERLW
jgi:ribosomal protein S18 acetylase RimI-like enzyme